MTKKICTFLAVLALIFPALKSTAQQLDPDRKINTAIKLMDTKLYVESEALLREVLSLDAKNGRALYELAFLQYKQRKYAEALKYAHKALKLPDVTDIVYQLAGNAADFAVSADRAIELYKKGLEKFPKSGPLYLELGNMAYKKKDYLKALEYFEQGIAVEPRFASNYRSAAIVFLQSPEPIWGLIYGEIFRNLEQRSQRSIGMGGILFNVYNNAIIIGEKDGKRNVEYGFTKNNEAYLVDGGFSIPFPLIFTLQVADSFPKDATEVNLETLNRMRCNFIAQFFDETDEASFGHLYSNVLFDYQRRIARAGHLEAYNYWLFGENDEREHIQWLKTHREQWDAFIEWFCENPLQLDKDHCFQRTQYDNIVIK